MSFLVKNILRKVIVKLATDKNMRNKVKLALHRAKNLNENGELIKTLGKSAGRLKNKLKK